MCLFKFDDRFKLPHRCFLPRHFIVLYARPLKSSLTPWNTDSCVCGNDALFLVVGWSRRIHACPRPVQVLQCRWKRRSHHCQCQTISISRVIWTNPHISRAYLKSGAYFIPFIIYRQRWSVLILTRSAVSNNPMPDSQWRNLFYSLYSRLWYVVVFS